MAKVVRKTDPKDEMLKFLMDKTGYDEQQIQIEMYKDRIKELAGRGYTIGEIMNVAKDEGFEDAFLAVKFADMLPRRGQGSSSSGSSRLTKQQTEELVENILAFLKKNPNSKIGDIVEAAGYDVSKVRPQLTKLKEEGKVQTEGTRRDTTYKLA